MERVEWSVVDRKSWKGWRWRMGSEGNQLWLFVILLLSQATQSECFLFSRLGDSCFYPSFFFKTLSPIYTGPFYIYFISNSYDFRFIFGFVVILLCVFFNLNFSFSGPPNQYFWGSPARDHCRAQMKCTKSTDLPDARL